MPSPEVLLTFFLTSVVLGAAPGPDNLFVLTQSALDGARSGFVVVLGLCTGLVVHTGLVAVGVAALLAASPVAFTILKLAGAAYLLWLAVGAFRAGAGRMDAQAREPTPLVALYRRGIIMNLTNPKVSIFFLAFLPQFADPSIGPIAPQILWLGAVFVAATVLVFGLFAVAAGRLGALLTRSPGAWCWLNRLAGAVFAGLAVRLVLASR